MTLSKRPKNVKINSYLSYYYYLNETLNEIKDTLNRDELELSLRGRKNATTYQLYIIAKYYTEYINCDYDEFVWSLQNISQIPYIYGLYNTSLNIILKKLYRILCVLDGNNIYPLDQNFNQNILYKFNYRLLHIPKREQTKYVKNKKNPHKMKKNKNNDKEEYRQYKGLYKDKSKNMGNNRWKTSFKKEGNQSFRRITKQMIKKGKYDKIPNIKNEVSNIWDWD